MSSCHTRRARQEASRESTWLMSYKRLQSKKSQLTALEVPSDDLWRGPWVGAGGDPGTLPRFVLSDWSHGRIHLARTTEPIRVLFSMYSVLQLKGVFWFFFLLMLLESC